LLIDSAKQNKIPYQLETGIRGATDAARIALSKEGVPSGIVAIPARYIHSPAAIVNIDDIEKTVQLLSSMLEDIPDNF
jgi:endoglucanase